ncbi:MAG: alpha/beta fold hydrolase [Desulfobacterales bacterium]|jgi:pimeloyl-ACP methyl ester carboxylesterase
MKTIAAFAAFLCLFFGTRVDAGAAGPNGACVVLLHGLARTSSSMETMAAALGAAGYRTVNIDYPSTEKPIEELAVEAVSEGLRQCRAAGAERIHFVTHSMGGLLVRYYLTQREVPELGRTVMLSPPNQGSEVADHLRDTAIYRWVNGPAGQQLGTGKDGIARRLPPVTYPVGVIAGNEASFFDAYFSDMIPGEDDGKVAVERAKVAGMADFIALPYGHTFIMEQADVIGQVLYFLENGRFQKEEGREQRTEDRKGK